MGDTGDPTDGTLIHYIAYNGRHLAGIVIGHTGKLVDIVVFTNMANTTGKKNFGVQFHQDVEYDGAYAGETTHIDQLRPGTWHWMHEFNED